MSEILILISKNLKNKIPPKLGYFKRGSEKVTWFPVIAISESSSMGVSETGEWVVQVAEGIHHLDNPHLYVYVIALLERPYKDVLDDIVDVFQKNQ